MRFLSLFLFVLIGSLSIGRAQMTETLIGYSQNGQPLTVYSVGIGPRSVLVIGAQHGDERPSLPLVADFYMDVLYNPGLISGSTVHFLLLANPDGWDANTRQNARGVDLNRNLKYDWSPIYSSPLTYPGPHFYSESESIALVEAIQLLQPKRILSVHAYANILDYDTAGGFTLAKRMAKKNGMTVATIGYPTPGSLGRYCTALNIPLVTLELPGGMPDFALYPWQKSALLEFVNTPL